MRKIPPRTVPRTVAIIVAACALTQGAFAAGLPKTTQAVLKELKMDASVLSGLEKELAVPKGWVAAAK